ncbi:uncharacterized protein N7515_006673 [Penicillium bovifimosum]|uniref:Uncharacterized protein n=1 Tax=Penicillium bovifimosum TaxID=126998 RepID=A0A9W9GV31_9EURO|nr:uncharacterized protein N7515_006673 [Penicillium bovifimosum]KAJ5130634.1 hypothetical protein N7515_006673 [Penicillium bovifimosum]
MHSVELSPRQQRASFPYGGAFGLDLFSTRARHSCLRYLIDSSLNRTAAAARLGKNHDRARATASKHQLQLASQQSTFAAGSPLGLGNTIRKICDVCRAYAGAPE